MTCDNTERIERAKMSNMRNVRVNKELEKLKNSPAWGVWCRRKEQDSDELEAGICGPPDSPYGQGVFLLTLCLPARYPIEPPQVTFVTPVYHPNIDQGGRICLDLLKMPPKGDWRPTVTLENVLLSIQTLLGSPNPDDPLVMDIAQQFISNREAFNAAAKEATLKYAVQK